MPIRPELARKLLEALGPEAADQMVEWMREVDRAGSRDVALRGDVAELRHEMQIGFAAMREEVARRASDLIKWSFVFWVGAVGAIAMLAGVLG